MVESVPSELLTFITKARLRGQVSLLSLDSESKAAVPIPHAAVVSLDELAALGLDARTAERWSLRHAEDHAAELIGHAWEGGTVIVQRPASVGGGDGAAVIGTRRLALALDEADIAEGLRGHSPT
ncbi:hypothetical protein [Nocardiopsis rhodophaea]|uniref:hypothetical protein n=1 Tax=Nocardiopsis rhodophaea TaxID=280238 RepID=UPI0031E42436